MLQYRVVRNVRKVASKMPCHPIDETGKEVPCPNGTTSNFGKHTTLMFQWIDNRIETIEGNPMSKEDMLEQISSFVRSYPNYRKRGGSDYAPQQAARIFSAMRKEGLIVEVR